MCFSAGPRKPKYVTRLTLQLLESSGEVHQLLSTKDSDGFFWILLQGNSLFKETRPSHLAPEILLARHEETTSSALQQASMNEHTLFQGWAWCSPWCSQPLDSPSL